MDENLKAPLKRLSEALQRAISDSAEVEEALRALREEGFAPFLMLEVTVGLSRGAEDDDSGDEVEIVHQEDGELTAPRGADLSNNDVEFLKALRIRLEE